MYQKDFEELLNKIADSINISEEMFDSAEMEYKKIGEWISKNTPQYDIKIYPQGSFALGTVVKPYDKEDEYDLDLVCEYQRRYGFSPKDLKKREVYSILSRYARVKHITEKRRCWQVTYEHNTHFHMDIIPAVLADRHIDITNQITSDSYEYIGSNPKEYIEWFRKKQSAKYTAIRSQILFEMRRNRKVFNAEVESVKEYKIKTPLQKAIQILKRHRDILFAEDENNTKPVSIIITTIAAELYHNENTIHDTLNNFLCNAKKYIEDHKVEGVYHIDNPTYTGGEKENFADKWKKHPERAEAFLNWLDDAKHDLIDAILESEDEAEIVTLVESCLGNRVANAIFDKKQFILNEAHLRQKENVNAVIPYKERMIMCAPHKQAPQFRSPKGYRVFITAKYTDYNGELHIYKNDGKPIPKNSSIEFRACFSGVKSPYVLKWQIVNTGEEARRVGQLRGEFTTEERNKTTHTESTLYAGFHSVQCFVLKKGSCLAKSRLFIVNIN